MSLGSLDDTSSLISRDVLPRAVDAVSEQATPEEEVTGSSTGNDSGGGSAKRLRPYFSDRVSTIGAICVLGLDIFGLRFCFTGHTRVGNRIEH